MKDFKNYLEEKNKNTKLPSFPKNLEIPEDKDAPEDKDTLEDKILAKKGSVKKGKTKKGLGKAGIKPLPGEEHVAMKESAVQNKETTEDAFIEDLAIRFPYLATDDGREMLKIEIRCGHLDISQTYNADQLGLLFAGGMPLKEKDTGELQDLR